METACCRSWLPFSLGDGTLYVGSCPHMSYYLVGALSTLGFAALHTGSMVVALDGWEKRDMRQGLLPSGAHLATALLVRQAAVVGLGHGCKILACGQ